MKALFLDIDGVICLNPPTELDEKCLANLKRIVEETGTVIVLSSTWRILPEAKQQVESTLEAMGLSLYGCTPRCFGPRRREIREFLNDHPEITDFVIIDDDRDASIDKHFFETSYFSKGLNEKVTRKVIKRLGTIPSENKAGE